MKDTAKMLTKDVYSWHAGHFSGLPQILVICPGKMNFIPGHGMSLSISLSNRPKQTSGMASLYAVTGCPVFYRTEVATFVYKIIARSGHRQTGYL